MYVRSLKKAGYEVDWIVDGNDGLSAARNKSYDVLLLDIMLPERRGSDILKALRGGTEDLIPKTKVVILTNFEQDDASREEMEKHADAYLIKAEITPKKLIEVLHQLENL